MSQDIGHYIFNTPKPIKTPVNVGTFNSMNVNKMCSGYTTTFDDKEVGYTANQVSSHHLTETRTDEYTTTMPYQPVAPVNTNKSSAFDINTINWGSKNTIERGFVDARYNGKINK